MPHPVLLLMDREAAPDGRRGTKRRDRLHQRCDAQQQRVLLRGHERAQKSPSAVTSSHVHTVVVMDTHVSIRTVGRDDPAAVERAFEWFRRIEGVCSRFDPDSEVRQLARHVNEPVEVSDILFGTANFALALAAETDGAFDPTVGGRMARRGFDRNYRTGERGTATAVDAAAT